MLNYIFSDNYFDELILRYFNKQKSLGKSSVASTQNVFSVFNRLYTITQIDFKEKMLT